MVTMSWKVRRKWKIFIFYLLLVCEAETGTENISLVLILPILVENLESLPVFLGYS